MMDHLDAAGYQTDKGKGMLAFYEKFFKPLMDKEIILLELGVKEGGSLYLWRDYFEKGTIVGVDIVPIEINDPTGRIRFYQGLQEDIRFLEKLGSAEAPEGFDIIIDDASHYAELTRIGFWYLFDNFLRPGGIFSVEDWGSGYWDIWPDGKLYRKYFGHRVHHTHGMVGFAKELVDECGIEDLTRSDFGLPPTRASKFEYIQFSPWQVMVVKRRDLPTRIPKERQTALSAPPGLSHIQTT